MTSQSQTAHPVQFDLNKVTDELKRQVKTGRQATHEVVADTYKDVEALIYDAVIKFKQQHGGDIYELMSEARISFMVAYKIFKRKKSAFTTCVRWVVSKGLLDVARKIAKKSFVRTENIDRFSGLRAKSEDVITDFGEGLQNGSIDLEDRPAQFNYEEFRGSLTSDGAYVAELAVRAPIEMLDPFLKRDNASTRESALVRFLGKRGWSNDRISKAWKEVEDALV